MIIDKNIKRVILVGEGGSGKNYLRKMLSDIGFNYAVSVTTRPIRKNEIDGIDYHFLSKEVCLNEYIPNNLFYEYVEFNGWIYGTLKKSFEDNNLFIMTPTGIKKIKEKDRKESIVIYINIPIEIRKKRLQERGDSDKAGRRLKMDEIDFNNFIDYDYKITNSTFSLNDIPKNILEIIKKNQNG